MELIVVMDAHEFKIAKDRIEHLEKENGELEAKLRSQANDLKQSIETIKCFQQSIYKLSCHAPISQEQLADSQQQIWLLT